MIPQRLLSGIFGHFFTRASIAIVSFALLLLVILLPFFRSQLLMMVETQGQSFANTTIAATVSNLYKEEYGEALDYIITVLKKSPDILFVVITKETGDEIVITQKSWYQSKHQLLFNKHVLNNKNHVMFYTDNNPITKNKSFIYHQSIDVGEVYWGVISIGMSDERYQYILHRYFYTVALTSISLVLSLLLLLFRSSQKVRQQISQLSATAIQLEKGNLSSRAPEYAIGEIGLLSASINKMAANLQDKTSHIIQLAQIVEQTNDAFVLFDTSLNIIFANEAVSDITGYPMSDFNKATMIDFTQVLGLSLPELLRELDWMVENNTDAPTRDIIITHSDGRLTYADMRLERISNASEDHQNFLVVLSDITQRKKLENELHQLAFYDKLTGLANRRMFQDHLFKTIKSAERNKKSFAIFFMDLDDFKNINDSLGHEAGDKLLIVIANRLKDAFRGNDLVARLGGDEFTITIEDIKEDSHIDLAYLAEKLLQDLAGKIIEVDNNVLNVSTSIGISIYPENGLDSETLLRNADTAMYAAKKTGKNRYEFFSNEMNTLLRQYLEIDADLKFAVTNGNQITYQYQPIINITTQELIGVEALARWHHPKKGTISPIEFIPIAEKSNLIIGLSNKLLNIAFKQVHSWSKQGLKHYLSVNISVRHFETPNFVDRIRALVEAYHTDPSLIQLEFTESIMLDSSEETLQKFNELKAMGFKIAIDDFGTGYSSLGYIHLFPIDVIKIDRSFVSGMLENKKTKTIVAAICRLSSTLKIKTIAEGIELQEHATILTKLHCEYGQGYLYDKPLNLADFEKKYFSNLNK